MLNLAARALTSLVDFVEAVVNRHGSFAPTPADLDLVSTVERSVSSRRTTVAHATCADDMVPWLASQPKGLRVVNIDCAEAVDKSVWAYKMFAHLILVFTQRNPGLMVVIFNSHCDEDRVLCCTSEAVMFWSAKDGAISDNSA